MMKPQLLRLFFVLSTIGLRQALTTQDVGTIKNSIRNLIPTNRNDDGTRRDKMGGIARLFFHDAFGHGTTPDGCIDFREHDNKGLESILELVNPVCDTYVGTISRADCWVLAGIVALEEGGMSVDIPFRYGRIDRTTCNDLGLLPKASPGGNPWNHIKDVFQTRGQLSTREIVALMGVHSLGRPSSDPESNSGFSGLNWVGRGDRLSTNYFSSIGDRGWTRSSNSLDTVGEWIGGNSIMLDVDMALVADVGTCTGRNNIRFGGRDTEACEINTEPNEFVTRFGASESEWHNALATGVQKMTELGYTEWELDAVPTTTKLCQVTTISNGRECAGTIEVADETTVVPVVEEETEEPVEETTETTVVPVVEEETDEPEEETTETPIFTTAVTEETTTALVAEEPETDTPVAKSTAMPVANSTVMPPIECPVLVAPEHAMDMECLGFKDAHACAFVCNEDFNAVGDLVRTCHNGVWSGSPLACMPANVKVDEEALSDTTDPSHDARANSADQMDATVISFTAGTVIVLLL